MCIFARVMRRLFLIVAIISLIVGCGQSYEETKRLNQAQRLKLFREDSAALKVAVMPTLDCRFCGKGTSVVRYGCGYSLEAVYCADGLRYCPDAQSCGRFGV